MRQVFVTGDNTDENHLARQVRTRERDTFNRNRYTNYSDKRREYELAIAYQNCDFKLVL